MMQTPLYMICDNGVAIARSWTDLVQLGESGYQVVSKTAWDKKRNSLQAQSSGGDGANPDRATLSPTEH